MRVLAVPLALSLVHPAYAAGSIFSLESELLNHPWHVFAMFVLVILISVAHEIFFEWLDHKVKSSSGRKLKEHMQHEVMNLGLIGLWLTFVDAAGFTHKFWSTTLFHYTHFVLFVMMIILMGLTGTLLVTMKIVWKTWVRYEEFWTMVDEDDEMPQGQKDITLTIYWARNQNAKRMVNCMKLFKISVHEQYAGIQFTRYLRKCQRQWVLRLIHLNKFSWISLIAVISVIASFLATKKEVFDDGTMDILYFVFSFGWGTLVLLLIVMAKVVNSFRRFCEEIDVTTVSFQNLYRPHCPSPDTSSYFWFRKPHLVIQVLQIIVLNQVFYLAIVIVNIIPKAHTIPLGWLLVISSLVPTVAIFGFLLPMMMPPFTCLASLGEFLDEKILATMLRDSAPERQRSRQHPPSHRSRRLARKEAKTMRRAEMEYARMGDLADDEVELSSLHPYQSPLMASSGMDFYPE